MTAGWIVLLQPGVIMTEPECVLHRPGGETQEHSRDLPAPGERDNISIVLRRREEIKRYKSPQDEGPGSETPGQPDHLSQNVGSQSKWYPSSARPGLPPPPVDPSPGPGPHRQDHAKQTDTTGKLELGHRYWFILVNDSNSDSFHQYQVSTHSWFITWPEYEIHEDKTNFFCNILGEWLIT